MLEQRFRAPYQTYLVSPIAMRLGQTLTALQITLLSALTGALVLPALSFKQSTLAIVLILVSGFFDTLDGTVARNNQTASPLGSVMDIMADRFVEFSIVLGLYLIAPEARATWSLLMLGAMLLCITSFLVVGIFEANHSEKSFHYSPGLMERAEAFIFFIAMILLPGLFSVLAFFFVLLVCYTAAYRLYEFYQAEAEVN